MYTTSYSHVVILHFKICYNAYFTIRYKLTINMNWMKAETAGE